MKFPCRYSYFELGLPVIAPSKHFIPQEIALKTWGFGVLTQIVMKCMGSVRLASVASFSVWFRSKERPWSEIFGFGRARNGTRAKKRKRRGGEGEGRKTLSPLSYSRHFSRGL